MLCRMKTTIHLPGKLLARAKKAALDRGTTLTEFIADALRKALARKKNRSARPATPMPRFTPPPGQEGLQPGVDLNNTAALLDLTDKSDAADRR